MILKNNERKEIKQAGVFMLMINEVTKLTGGISVEFINGSNVPHEETYYFNPTGLSMLNKLCLVAGIDNISKSITDKNDIIGRRVWCAIREEHSEDSVSYHIFKVFAHSDKKPLMADDPELKHGIVTGDFKKIRVIEMTQDVKPDFKQPSF